MVYSEKQYKLALEKAQKISEKIEILKKENALLKTQNKQKDEVIYDLDKFNFRGKAKELEVENKELKKKVNAYEELLGIKITNLKKDSSNSCKPSSTDGFKKVIQNNRVKTGRKPGREKGHLPSAPTISTNPDKVISVENVKTCKCGCNTVELEECAREEVSIKVVVTRTQYKGKKTVCPHCKKEYTPNFPKRLINTMQYDNSIKSFIVFLNSYCSVPMEKTSELISFLTDEKIKLAPATVANVMKQFTKKSEVTISEIKDAILKEDVVHEDETPIGVNGKVMSAIGIFTKKLTFLQAHKNRKEESFEALSNYKGTVVHDHNKMHEIFTNYIDAECNMHVLKYCKGEYEIHKRECIKNFMNYLIELRDRVKALRKTGKMAFTELEYNEAKEKYLDLLLLWDMELKDIDPKNKYHLGEKRLKDRLRKYVDDHLRFIADFKVSFTNNLAERGLRGLKTKIKVAGCFRNLKNAQFHCNSITVIQTCKKQQLNIKDILEKIFNQEKNIFAL